jgi:hypothetical protein
LAHVDTPKGDLDHDNVISTTTIITDSTVYPYGTSEMFPLVQDSVGNAVTQSAHAYMECSNKGICDRTTGQCECFDGYDGAACQRASCPNDCSGHGTCETISDLAAKDSGSVYKLWDKDASMGCMCDSGYSSADCSSRQCKSGVDPLFTDDNFVTDYKAMYKFRETSASPLALGGVYALKIFDSFGEDFVTSDIAIDSATDAISISAINTALAALPSNAGAGITCTAVVGTTGNHAVTIEFTNSGARKAMEVVEKLDGKSLSVTVSPLTVDLTSASVVPFYELTQWTETIGESTDHFATKCAGVSVDVFLAKDWTNTNTQWAPVTNGAGDGGPEAMAKQGSVGFVSTGSGGVAMMNVLKTCLGDSDGNTANNVEIYNWDHGAVLADTPLADKHYVGSHPHAIKIADDAGNSDYVLVWWDAGVLVAGWEMRTVNMLSDTNFATANYNAAHRTLSVYTTSGVVTQLAKDVSIADGGSPHHQDKILTNYQNETKLTGYFAQYSNLIYTNYDGSCDSAEIDQLHLCIEKGDLLFVVDGCWGEGDRGYVNGDAQTIHHEIFGGDAIGCALIADITAGTGMLYTVTKTYTQDWSGNTTAYDSTGGFGFKGQEDRFVVEVDHNIKWDGSAIGNPDNSDAFAVRLWGQGFTGLVVLFKFVPATDGSDYTYYSECSNRGSCDGETGLCACFKGYTSDNCSTQSALAV